jgi:hypothetical protein
LTPEQKQQYATMTSDPHFIETVNTKGPERAIQAYLAFIQKPTKYIPKG